MKISLISIGDEILVGQVLDTNGVRIAQALADIGQRIDYKWTIGDTAQDILYTMREAANRSDCIIITGGLGPTKDDITKKVMAQFFNVKLDYSPKAYQHLEAMLSSRNIEITDSHKTQCYIPSNAQLLDNQKGTALGLQIEDKDLVWFAMPGVPYEMEYILIHSIIPFLKSKFGHISSYHRTIHIMGIGETKIADTIEPLIKERFPEIKIAYLPSLGYVRVRLTSDDLQSEVDKEQVDEAISLIRSLFERKAFGTDDTNLATELGIKLKSLNKTIGCAESCTGGYASHLITSVSGASEFFKGSIIAYSNEIKQSHLNVPKEVLDQHGAVSEATVRRMVIGACKALGTDISVAISGIAGPSGGTTEKPVGTVWIAAGNQDHQIVKLLKLGKDRQQNIEAAAYFALILAWEWLLDS